MNIFAWLLSVCGPIAIRVALSLGVSVFTVLGVNEIMTLLITTAQNSWAALPLAALQLVSLSGIPQVLGMTFGAYASRMAIWAASSATKYMYSK